MSSLQKFHRRTNGGAPEPTWPALAIGGGDVTHGFWLGTAGDGTSKLVVVPKSTEVSLTWGSYNIVRGTISTTNGLANTNTLAGFGQAAHPAAYYCKNLTTGGYNTWYMPAKDELNTLYINKSATPFATANSFALAIHLSSTESNGKYAWIQSYNSGSMGTFFNKTVSYHVRAVRRSTI